MKIQCQMQAVEKILEKQIQDVRVVHSTWIGTPRINPQPVGGGPIGPQQIVAEKFSKIRSNLGAL